MIQETSDPRSGGTRGTLEEIGYLMSIVRLSSPMVTRSEGCFPNSASRGLITLALFLVCFSFLSYAQPLMHPEEYLKEGIERYQQGDFDGAIRLLGLAVVGGFEDIEALTQAHLYLGLSYLAFGKTTEAENAFTRLIERRPSFTIDAERYPPKAVSLFNKVRATLVSGWMIRTDPPGAEIWQGTVLLGTSDEQSGVFRREAELVGKYTLRIHKRHYKDVTVPIEVVPGEVRQQEVTLERKMLRLRVSAGPDQVTVSADGQALGHAPVTITRPSGSSMHLVCDRPYYVSQDFTVRFDETQILVDDQALPVSGDLATLKVTLEPLPPGSLRVETEPKNATVLLDKQLVGQTPITLDSVAAGPHHLEVYLDAYPGVQEDILIASGQEQVRRYLLGMVLNIRSFPSGAMIQLGEQLLGQTPLHTVPLPPGDLVLHANYPGYFPYRQAIRIEGKGTQDVELSLVPETGGLSIHSSPSDAEVLLDGKERGHTPLILLHLPVGKHTLEIQHPGYIPHRTQVEVRLQEIQWQTFALKPDIVSSP
ncbi:MAG: PEGA domain-containing protein [Nitrospinota bacterium]|nr:MAG: PEGA domain-containing protein [Nitrospinota bacterium]